jgi:DNA-binding PadR family transcriptional regulator
MYELIILSLLARGTTHGYVIAGVINDVIGPFARASNGRIYPLLTKLEEDGLVTVHQEVTSDGGRTARAFGITPAGRVRFRQLMTDTSSGPREYRDLFAFKVTAFDQLANDDRRRIVEHYADFAAAHIRHLETQATDIESASNYGHTPEHRARFANVFRHLVATWRREAEWAAELLREEDSARQRRPPKRERRRRNHKT